jgi:hypothetical protein
MATSSVKPEMEPPAPGQPIGNVYYGTCSWTEPTLIESGTFYPHSA